MHVRPEKILEAYGMPLPLIDGILAGNGRPLEDMSDQITATAPEQCPDKACHRTTPSIGGLEPPQYGRFPDPALGGMGPGAGAKGPDMGMDMGR